MEKNIYTDTLKENQVNLGRLQEDEFELVAETFELIIECYQQNFISITEALEEFSQIKETI